MRPTLSLHHINALDTSPTEFIALASAAGVDQVSMFIYVPPSDLPDHDVPGIPLITREMKSEMQARLADCAMEIAGIDYFPVSKTTDFDDCRSALALGRELGARIAVTQVHDDDHARAIDHLGKLCDIAAGEDMKLGLEFTGLTPGCASLQSAARFVEAVGRDNLGIGLDALHLVRTGGKAADVAALPVNYLSYAQICDSIGLHVTSDYMHEALERRMPGEGDFPLDEILAFLPPGLPIDIEVPSLARAREGVDAGQYLSLLVARTKHFLSAVDAER